MTLSIFKRHKITDGDLINVMIEAGLQKIHPNNPQTVMAPESSQ